jgi:hypothetical protein
MAATVYVHDDRVTIDLDGADRLWCLASHLEVPMEHITSARVASRSELVKQLSWRTLGAYWPGVVATGWYMMRDRPGARQFWCVYRDSQVLVIDTDLDRPARVVIQHPDRDRLAWLIGERVPHRD